jgi:DNA-binding Lrp family transcriptional regulator
MTKLDAYDCRILDALDRASNLSLSQLAREIRLGRDLVDYRCTRLVNIGVISGFRAVVDPWRQRFQVFKVFLKLKSQVARIAQFQKSLRAHPFVFWCALCDGHWDLFFTCIEVSPTSFFFTQQSILEPFSDLILEKEIAINVQLHTFSRGYLAGKESKAFSMGGEPAMRALSDLETSILRKLSEDSRTSLSVLARATHASAATIRSHIQAMEKERVLVGYKIDVDLKKLGRIFFKVRVHLKTPLDSALIERMRAFCKRDPDITYLVVQIGSCPIEISVEALGYEHLQTVLHRFSAAFQDELSRVETLLVREPSQQWKR